MKALASCCARCCSSAAAWALSSSPTRSTSRSRTASRVLGLLLLLLLLRLLLLLLDPQSAEAACQRRACAASLQQATEVGVLAAKGPCGRRQAARSGGAKHPPVALASGAAAGAVGPQFQNPSQEEIQHPSVCLLEQGLARKDALGSKVRRREAGQGLPYLKPGIGCTTLRPAGALQVARRPGLGVPQLARCEQLGPHGLLAMWIWCVSTWDRSNGWNCNQRNLEPFRSTESRPVIVSRSGLHGLIPLPC